jgi:amino acid transporter
MLAMEALTVLAITALGVRIILEVHPTVEQSLATLRPSTEFHGWAGVGLGMVFTILSFGGFEGAATLGEETINPRRNIPVAMLSTVFLTGLFFIFVSYCEVIGFGPEGLHSRVPMRPSTIWRCVSARVILRRCWIWRPQ